MAKKLHLASLFYLASNWPVISGFLQSKAPVHASWSLDGKTSQQQLGHSSRQFQLNLVPKTKEETAFIRECLLENALFSSMSELSLQNLIENFEKAEGGKGEVITRQGEPADNGFVNLVAEGTCKVFVDEKEVPEPFNILKAGT
ncbi:unnamed protein product [Cylindrotheca closterium]|uniref:Cyclic nucleotide-binding domain-containing protein n=1 Tax=Cylindrotheca closterium TaxID=2856 RepID=A0AAD2PVQ5_9STRA|nr:unnamed protein product [Cylindrotheca closterium]